MKKFKVTCEYENEEIIEAETEEEALDKFEELENNMEGADFALHRTRLDAEELE